MNCLFCRFIYIVLFNLIYKDIPALRRLMLGSEEVALTHSGSVMEQCPHRDIHVLILVICEYVVLHEEEDL